MTDLRAGDVLAGKYRVDRVLGTGGMGVVVAAHHLGLDTKVAIKLLLPEMLRHEDVVARFAREARSAAKITNDHVTRVFDVGVLEDGAPFIVMELLDGIDLHQWLQQRGPLAVEQAVDFLLQACEAVAEAHALGIVHRDLKPANLFCVRRADGTLHIKVLDFGISKVAAGGASGVNISMTQTSTVLGTPFYMSPEQMESAREVDGRADVWALGVILFELLTGKVPFAGDTLPEVCFKIATHAPPPIRRVRADVPAAVESVILRCLEKDRKKRIASVLDLASALAPLGTQQGVASAERVRRSTHVPSGDRPAESGAFFDAKRGRPKMGESLAAVENTKGGRLSRRKAVTSLVAGALAGVAIAAALVIAGAAKPVAAPAASQSNAKPDAALPTGAALAEPAPVPAHAADEPPKGRVDLTPIPEEPGPDPAPRRAPPKPAVRPHAPPTAAAPPDATRSQPEVAKPQAAPAPRHGSEPDPNAGAFDERL